MFAALFALVFPLILLLCGLWLAAINGWHMWGVALMGAALIILIKKIMGFLSLSLHTAHQINLLHESRKISDEYGHARLANTADNFVKALNKNRSGFYIGSMGDMPLFYDPYQTGNGHMLTYAPSRTGKTISMIVPALLHWFGGSMFVTDVKGELTAITAKYRKKRGHNVLIFNPFNVLGIKGVRFNPLRILVEDVMKNQGKDLHDLARLLAFQLIAERPNDMGDGVFFRNGGRKLIITFLLYMAVFMPDSCTLPTLRKLIWSRSGKQKAIAFEMRSSDWLHGLLQDYGNGLAEMLKSEYIKTYGAFRDNAMNALEIYDAHSPLGAAMSYSDFKLADVLNGKTTLYVILPEAKLETHGSALGLIATLLLGSGLIKSTI